MSSTSENSLSACTLHCYRLSALLFNHYKIISPEMHLPHWCLHTVNRQHAFIGHACSDEWIGQLLLPVKCSEGTGYTTSCCPSWHGDELLFSLQLWGDWGYQWRGQGLLFGHPRGPDSHGDSEVSACFHSWGRLPHPVVCGLGSQVFFRELWLYCNSL